MSTELAIIDDRVPVIMKSKLVHWVKPETGERIQAELQNQTGHRFMRITELAITINTAEVEGVYGREQYEDLAKIKAGMTQCAYRTWHAKGEACDCRRRLEREADQRRREREQAESDRELTPAERQRNSERLAEIRRNLGKKGIILSTRNHRS